MQVGSPVRLVGDPGRVGVIISDTRERGGRSFISVQFPDGARWMPLDQLEEIAATPETPCDLLRRGRVAAPDDLYRALVHIQLAGRLANYIYSLDTTGTDFYAYQFKPVLKLLQSVSTGILIADEVGLGKTIEAGLIWTELRSRFDMQRLLIVCPAMLRPKWQAELRRRFGVKAEVYDAEELLTRMRAIVAGSETELLAVASLQGLRPGADWADDITPAGPRAELARLLAGNADEEPLIDLLVIDEAHYLRNPEARTHELGQLLRRVSQFAVLLSATPVQLRSDDLFHLLRIVDEDLFTRPDVFEEVRQANTHLIEARELALAGRPRADIQRVLTLAQRNPLLAENRQIEMLIAEMDDCEDALDTRRRVEIASRLEAANLLGYSVTRTRRREVTEWSVIREAKTLKVALNPLEREFYETVTETVRTFCARGGHPEGFVLVMPQRQMASCMAAALWYWTQDEPQALEELYEDLGLELPEAEPASLGPLIAELRANVHRLGNLASLAREDSKYTELHDQLRRLLKDAPNPEKVVLFSSFRHTLRYLEERLRKDGISCIRLVGGDTDKEQVLTAFCDPLGPSLLLSSEVGSEGIDLQFAWLLINYDLPWNPMRVEQRIGRLDRIGQQSPRVVIWNLIHEETIDERIYDRLFLRLNIFQRTLGSLEAVLGDQIRQLTDDLFRRHLTAEEEAARIDQTTIAIENKRRHEEELEGEAASLVAYGDYILNQVEAARRLDRRVTDEDLQRYVSGFLSMHYPGCRLTQAPEGGRAFDIELSAEAKNDLAAYLRNRRSSITTALARNLPGPVRCRFENRVGQGAVVREEVISQVHPLVRFAAQRGEEPEFASHPAAVAMRLVATTETVVLAEPGDYLFLITRWMMEALRPFEQLWFGCVRVDDGQWLPPEDAERLLTAAARTAQPWPTAHSELDLARLAHQVEDVLLARAWETFETEVARLKAQNDDRADAQERSLRTHLDRQRERIRQLADRHRLRGRVGLAKAEEKNLERLVNRVDRELLALAKKRILLSDLREVSAGVLRVS
jgi:superfamily II DNA or RNA helicase